VFLDNAEAVMTASKAGGQIEKVKPPGETLENLADTPKDPPDPKPQPPYQLAGNATQCDTVFEDATQCAYEREDLTKKFGHCKLCNWKYRNRVPLL
jgi:hypothetical protein